MRSLIILVASLSVAGCAVIDRLKPGSATAPPAPVEAVAPVDAPAAVVLGQGVSAAALDATSTAEKQQALAVPASGAERALGKVAVSLGSPTEQGFWLRSALVTAPGKGRVVTSGGQSVAVDLLPGASAAQLSLAAFRALGLNLTDLPEVTVYAN